MALNIENKEEKMNDETGQMSGDFEVTYID